MKTIPLTKGYFSLVDDEDYESLSLFRWHASVDSRSGRVRAMRKVTTPQGRKNVHMARIVKNCPENMFVDHINMNTLDNRKHNLRICTFKQNIRNRTMKNLHGFKGVHFRGGKWQARITVDGKTLSLGNFEKVDEAALAYDKGARKYFKEYANINFNEEHERKL